MRSLKKRRLAQWSASADQGKVTEGVPTPVVQLSAIDPEKCRLFIGAYSLDPLSSTVLLLLFIHFFLLDPCLLHYYCLYLVIFAIIYWTHCLLHYYCP